MGYEDAISQSANKAIALLGECGRYSVLCGWKGREDEQTTILERRLEVGLQTHSDNAPSGNPDDGLAATEKNSEALPFHDRVKASDEDLAFVAHLGHGVKRFQDDGAGALGRTEEGDLRMCEQLGGTCCPELRGCARVRGRQQ